jgi:hypothetical protein
VSATPRRGDIGVRSCLRALIDNGPEFLAMGDMIVRAMWSSEKESTVPLDSME